MIIVYIPNNLQDTKLDVNGTKYNCSFNNLFQKQIKKKKNLVYFCVSII